MSRPPAAPQPLQIVGESGDMLSGSRRGSPMAAAATGALVIAAMVVAGMFPGADGSTAVIGTTAAISETSPVDSKLLHPLGGPVDAVERFMAAISYGEAEVAAQALAPETETVQLPFLSATPERLTRAVAIYRDTRAVISMHGCNTIESAAQGTSVEVGCTISFDSAFIRDLEAKNLQGYLRFLVDGGLISSVSVVDLDSPVDAASDLDGLFDRWLADFYFATS